ncbi:cupin domain-containing protein [Natrinema sp. 74]|uniref:cupin domain-containing protein n=1 Tax=Natrinema sp. 74 TaxID=3384159 RepID=UPI0038D39739
MTMSEDYGFVNVETVAHDSNPDPTSEMEFGKLTETLGCEEMRLNTCTIPPGDEGPYHKHESQEEVYVLLDGPGHVTVDGDLVDVPEGGIVRLPAETPRKFVNETGEEQRWLMIGAPPVGTVDDMGEFVMVEE